MKNLKKIILTGLSCYLMSCSNSNESSKNSTDSLMVKDSIIKDTIVKTAEVKDPATDLNLVFKEIITTMKSGGDLSKLNKYIYPGMGVYHLYTVGDFNISYDKYDKLEKIKSSQASGTGPNSYDNFTTLLAKTDTTLLSLNYDLITANECKLKTIGTFGILIQTPVTFLSDCYNSIIQTTGNDPDPAELKQLKAAESKATEKVILNIFDNSTGNGAEVFYFAQIDKKWYLLALDLTDCGGEGGENE